MSRRASLKIVCLIILVMSAAALSAGGPAAGRAQGKAAAQARKGCEQGDGGLTLPTGFCASVFADNLGRARHLTVAPNGDVYVNTWSS